jgi:ribosome-interacting GTPase 1
MVYELSFYLYSAQVIAVARTADLVLMMLDATKQDVQRGLLEKELESVGIRLNKKKPNIYFKVSPFSFSC